MDKIWSVQMYATVLLPPHSDADAISATRWRHFKYDIPVPCLPHEDWCNRYLPLGSSTIAWALPCKQPFFSFFGTGYWACKQGKPEHFFLAQPTGQSIPIGGATGAAR